MTTDPVDLLDDVDHLAALLADIGQHLCDLQRNFRGLDTSREATENPGGDRTALPGPQPVLDALSRVEDGLAGARATLRGARKHTRRLADHTTQTQ
ncbi:MULTISPECIES: hypothetical protein [Rhodococcus]|uniref:hypothetical protein n=1 Tax=Rhodococcus TaxID=1827 RepID=UPI001E3FA0AF|nr:hypothetical protein [Rhodococcus pyridinivorans]MCD2119434.1 hypothetical protein [Rhodococcus pyridinivorans]MCZ4628335.1 hypothetical protein [Rhodococcus pyridinivorans]MCZ4649600.1 hypothetical protein [Rhodococcus pyridinivorans]MDJ0483682.1 hypothetical protein [Rhodococcus pyridinivorans]MDV7255667.1 hypothetical protein [Rhodococcus pyridinivorans]